MNIKPVNTEADYRAALKDVESLMMIRNLNQGLGISAEILIQPSTKIHAS
jgi:antitoxin component HigA of HigAB toxin-antitoxin module